MLRLIRKQRKALNPSVPAWGYDTSELASSCIVAWADLEVRCKLAVPSIAHTHADNEFARSKHTPLAEVAWRKPMVLSEQRQSAAH